jgi:DUF2075 family protein
MTGFRIRQVPFNTKSIGQLSLETEELSNWPVVYTLNDKQQIYIGETTNVEMRMRQHLQSEERQKLKLATVILDATYNKSACLDLESHLISYFHADGKYQVLNRNGGLTDSDYYQRATYRESFKEIFEDLHKSGMLTRSIPEIVNSDFFKYSPFKALNSDQAIAVEGVLEKLTNDIENKTKAPIVIQGDPGTGKTIVAIYLIKLIEDIRQSTADDILDVDSLFSDFFAEGYRETFKDLSIALVIPQVSLRSSIRKVFKRTPGLSAASVISQFELAKSGKVFDVVIVDEAHRLQHRANQPSASQNKDYREINIRLFGKDDIHKTQIDWIKACSKHQIFLVDSAQSVKPADVPSHHLESLVSAAQKDHSFFRLISQMRVMGGTDYIDFIRKLLNQTWDKPQPDFGEYEFKFFDDFKEMRREIEKRNQEHGLARLVAGFAWPWASKRDKKTYDIEIQGEKLRWNSTASDWINSPNSVEEVGSIHTVQGYDLNYAGVIIGPELGYDEATRRITFNRDKYFDVKGKENNPTLGIFYTDEDLRKYVLNVYRVLLTRGIRGTYVHITNPLLRSYLTNSKQNAVT